MSSLMLLLLVLVILLGLFFLRAQQLKRQAEQAVPQIGKIHKLPGGAIHYVDLGPKDGQPIVMIHGLSAQLQHFTYGVTDLLSDEFRLIVLDRPGCGYSERDPGHETLDHQGRMIWALLDDLGLSQPVLAGHSLGGALSLNMALSRPGDVGALALISPATHVTDDIHPVFKPLLIRSVRMRRFMANFFAGPMGHLMAQKTMDAVFAPELCPKDFMIRAAAILGLRPKGFIGPSEEAVMMEKAMRAMQPRYKDLTVPGGVLYGTEDPLLDPVLHGESMQAYGLDYRALPGRGHMPPFTAPDDCATFIRDMAAKAGWSASRSEP